MGIYKQKDKNNLGKYKNLYHSCSVFYRVVLYRINIFFVLICSQNNDTDNPTSSKLRSISDSNPPQNLNRQGIRVTPNPRHTSYPHIPPVISESSSINASSIPFGSKPNQASSSAFKYRPKTLNTTNTSTSDKNQEQAKPSNIASRKTGSLNRNEPVYATVGSVNSNQRLVKNLKSANV